MSPHTVWQCPTAVSYTHLEHAELESIRSDPKEIESRFYGPLEFGTAGLDVYKRQHVDGVAVLPLDERNNVITVSQYRYVFGKTLLEIPAGKLDPGEEPAVGALRELREETGAVPYILMPLGVILPSPGCYGEHLHLFLARERCV